MRHPQKSHVTLLLGFLSDTVYEKCSFVDFYPLSYLAENIARLGATYCRCEIVVYTYSSLLPPTPIYSTNKKEAAY